MAQTHGTTSNPITNVTMGSSDCVSYNPELCFRTETSVEGVVTVSYETVWQGTCLGGQRDVIITACLDAESRAFPPGSAGSLQCTVEPNLEDGPEVSLSRTIRESRFAIVALDSAAGTCSVGSHSSVQLPSGVFRVQPVLQHPLHPTFRGADAHRRVSQD